LDASEQLEIDGARLGLHPGLVGGQQIHHAPPDRVVSAANVSVERLAELLSKVAKAPVIDQTGIKVTCPHFLCHTELGFTVD
jgi:hypothetical protein